MSKNLASTLHCGADTDSAVTDAKIALAKMSLGDTPRFWGRYFKTPGSAGSGQYHGKKEGPVLRKHGIYVLPIARQTDQVGKGAKKGAEDAQENVAALFEAFGKFYIESRSTKLLVFLDSEPQSPMSSSYYSGWSKALVEPQGGCPNLAPAIYSSTDSVKTWKALAKAISSGAQCHGVWVARYLKKTGCVPVPQWQDKFLSPKDLPPQCTLFAWQYSQECAHVDYSLINPANENELMSGLILPPDQSVENQVEQEQENGQASAENLETLLTSTVAVFKQSATNATLPDGKPYFFPNGITGIDVTFTLGTAAEVRLNIEGK